jgi:methylated-DNA-[protein]-cysteine S-methyltransferase
MKQSIAYSRCASPLGEMLLVAAGDALSGVYFSGQKYHPAVVATWHLDHEDPVLHAARMQLAEYFAGQRTRFALPLAPVGTPFQRAVWSGIATVPAGATISYTELALRAGHPGCVRAAGAATGRNPWSIVIPCHRIVGANGALVGYAGGLERKRSLLALERAANDSAARRAA